MAQCGGRRKAPGRPFPPPRTSVWNNSYETLVGGASNGDDNDELPLTPPDAVYAPTRSGCQAPKKPGASALYYERVLDVVIEHVFGWDTKRQAPKVEGGLLGHTCLLVHVHRGT
jgi:hypothetical protein